jgi:hypothetical protein
MSLSEQLGRAAGWVIGAPFFGTMAALRRSRPLHPTGELYEATCTSSEPSDDLRPLADALHGTALVRLSHALWKRPRPHVPDVLGCALRFGADQDILFATVKRPWTTPFAPLTTDVDAYLGNIYYGVSPFTMPGMSGRFYLRLRPFVDDKLGGFVVEASPHPRRGYREVARVTLDRLEEGGGARMHFDPFRTGRGIEPRGFVHALRHGAYSASQTVRSALGSTVRASATS